MASVYIHTRFTMIEHQTPSFSMLFSPRRSHARRRHEAPLLFVAAIHYDAAHAPRLPAHFPAFRACYC